MHHIDALPSLAAKTLAKQVCDIGLIVQTRILMLTMLPLPLSPDKRAAIEP
jgi:hypothetical protein